MVFDTGRHSYCCNGKNNLLNEYNTESKMQYTSKKVNSKYK